MHTPADYIEKNRKSWNQRTDIHVKSEFYDLDGFIKGKSSLNDIELKMLGDISGKSILHLQCHFGQDTISLGRMGADVTGIDLSDNAINKANELAAQTGVNARFICSDVYELDKHLDEQFDIVFTSYGTIGWLPDLDKWAGIVSKFLKPGGRFIFVEFHPVVWMFDDNFEKIGYNYFNTAAIIETEQGTYADKKADVSLEYVCWNHSLAEVMNSLIGKGLEINQFNEYDHSPYNIFVNSIEVAPGKFRVKQYDNKVPLVYSILAIKRLSQ
jgi:SAM-dependent methyltransferase